MKKKMYIFFFRIFSCAITIISPHKWNVLFSCVSFISRASTTIIYACRTYLLPAASRVIAA